MPPSPEKKPDLAKEIPNAGPNPVDIQSILLPKKESGPNVDSAQRINAGALWEQEENATLLEPKPALQEPPAPKQEVPSGVSPLQTYRGDVEQVVHEGTGVSVVSIAAAEAERRGKQPLNETPEEKQAARLSRAMLAGGAALVLVAAGTLAFVFARTGATPPSAPPQAPFMFVDDTVLVPVPASDHPRDTLMTSLQTARDSVRLSVGLIEWLYVAQPGTSTPRELTAAELVGTLAPRAPDQLLRTLQPTYLVGVHSFDSNQPFLLLQVDSYETAYAGMLAWEPTMQGELAPFFNRKPSPRPNQIGAGATTTEAASSTPFLQTGFVDKIVENRDTRAVVNDAGDILLLWTFLGRNMILITTNEYTLREVLSRLNTAPVVPLPGK